MKVTVTISLVRAFPKRYEWGATRPDGREYTGSSGSIGSSAQAMEDADQAFKNPAITWDWEYALHAPEGLATPVHRGHVFVAEAE